MYLKLKHSVAIIIIVLFSACSISSNIATKQISAKIVSSKDNKVANIIKGSLSAGDDFIIHIADEIRQKNISTLDKNVVTTHKLTISIAVEVYKRGKLLLKEVISASVYNKNSNTTTANELQENINYEHIREKLAGVILIKLLNLYANKS